MRHLIFSLLLLSPAWAEPDHFAAGRTLLQAGKPAEATREFNLSLAHSYCGRGTCLAVQNRHDEALQDFQRSLDLVPLPAAYQGRGASLTFKRDFTAALEAYQKASELDPKYAEPHYGRATVFKLMGQKAQARAEFQHFLRLTHDPTWAKRARDELDTLK